MEIGTIEKFRWEADSRHWSILNFGTNSEEIRKRQKRAFGPLSHDGPERNLARTIVLVVVLHVLHIQRLNRDEQSRLQKVCCFFCRLELTGRELMNLCVLTCHIK